MTQKLTIDYILFKEGSLFNAYSPQLELLFNGETEKEALRTLKLVSLLQIATFDERKTLTSKIEKLGLIDNISSKEKALINLNLQIPYQIILNENRIGKFNLKINKKLLENLQKTLSTN